MNSLVIPASERVVPNGSLDNLFCRLYDLFLATATMHEKTPVLTFRSDDFIEYQLKKKKQFSFLAENRDVVFTKRFIRMVLGHFYPGDGIGDGFLSGRGWSDWCRV